MVRTARAATFGERRRPSRAASADADTPASTADEIIAMHHLRIPFDLKIDSRAQDQRVRDSVLAGTSKILMAAACYLALSEPLGMLMMFILPALVLTAAFDFARAHDAFAQAASKRQQIRFVLNHLNAYAGPEFRDTEKLVASADLETIVAVSPAAGRIVTVHHGRAFVHEADRIETHQHADGIRLYGPGPLGLGLDIPGPKARAEAVARAVVDARSATLAARTARGEMGDNVVALPVAG